MEVSQAQLVNSLLMTLMFIMGKILLRLLLNLPRRLQAIILTFQISKMMNQTQRKKVLIDRIMTNQMSQRKVFCPIRQ